MIEVARQCEEAKLPDIVATRPTAPFTVYYRMETGEGGFVCRTCSVYRNAEFARISDPFAAAAQHLNLCRAGLRHRPVEGSAIINGVTHGVVLREGIMILALDTVFRAAPLPVRVVA